MNRVIFSVVLVVFCSISALFAQNSFRYDVKSGIDNLVDTKFSILSGKKVALVTNQTGRMRSLTSTLEAFLSADSCKLVSILAPEHGYFGSARAGEALKDSNETLRGIPLYSLYGATRRPNSAMLASCDAVVFDIQDIGVRSYTFLSTLFNVMDACAEFGKPLYVLDRPNPLGGKIVNGNVLDSGLTSFVGIIPVPYLHGCTFGELATMINGENWLPKGTDSMPRKCKLTVVKLKRWQRWMTWEDTDFTWVPTSPHIPTLGAVRGAAMLGIWGELGFVNIGVGYLLPFQMLGSPTLKTDALIESLKQKNLAGIQLMPTVYRPFYGKVTNVECQGILFSFSQDTKFRPYSAGVEIMLALRKTNSQYFADSSAVSTEARMMFMKTSGSRKLFEALFQNLSEDEIRQIISAGVPEFIEMRKKYLLYE